MNENTPLPEGTGFLVVQASTASGAIPLEGATVTITGDDPQNTEILFVLTTGTDGRTARVPLSAPPRSASLSFDGGRAFATYHIRVQAKEYTDAEYSGVPIFDGITAIQQAELIPIPANGYPDDFSLNRPQLYSTGNEQDI